MNFAQRRRPIIRPSWNWISIALENRQLTQRQGNVPWQRRHPRYPRSHGLRQLFGHPRGQNLRLKLYLWIARVTNGHTCRCGLFEQSYLLSKRKTWDKLVRANEQHDQGENNVRVEDMRRIEGKTRCVLGLEKESTWRQFDGDTAAVHKFEASPLPSLLPSCWPRHNFCPSPNYFTANLESTPYPCSFAVTDAPKSSLQ